MEKSATLGELLYIISSYEKGRIKSSRMWSKQYIDSLKKSLLIMETILGLLKCNRNITIQEITPILDFYLQNVHTIFPESTINVNLLLEDTSEVIFKESSLNKEDKKIIEFMENIIRENYFLMTYKGKKYKLKISYLLKAFHNLPKIFLDTSKQTFCNIGIQPISREEAMEYSLFYINIINAL